MVSLSWPGEKSFLCSNCSLFLSLHDLSPGGLKDTWIHRHTFPEHIGPTATLERVHSGCVNLCWQSFIRCYPDWGPTSIESKTRKILTSLFSQFSQASGPDDDCHTPIPSPQEAFSWGHKTLHTFIHFHQKYLRETLALANKKRVWSSNLSLRGGTDWATVVVVLASPLWPQGVCLEVRRHGKREPQTLP